MNVPFLLICLLVSLSGLGQTGLPPVYELTKDTTEYAIDTAHFQLLEDRTGKLAIAQVSQPALSGNFYYDAFKNEDRNSPVYWIRMRLRNNLPTPVRLLYNDFYSDYIDVYTRPGNTPWLHQQGGNLCPLSQVTLRAGVRERNRFLVVLQPGQVTTLYHRSRVVGWRAKLTTITPGLQTETAHVQSAFLSINAGEWKSYFYDGIMLGVLLLAAICNLLIFGSIRDRTYLYFGLCLLFIGLDRNTYLIQRAFFSDYPYAFSVGANFFFAAYFVFFIQAIRTFIRPDAGLRRLNRWTTFFLLLSVGLTSSQPILGSLPHFPVFFVGLTNELLIRITYLLVVIMNVRMIRQGFVQARFSLIATLPLFSLWLVTLANPLSGLLFKYNILGPYYLLFSYLENACFAWLIIFFCGALVGRYNEFSRQVSRQVLEREQLERERVLERNRLIADQNEQLERQVRERTTELQTSLDTLNATQAQLIQSEKMASLGELTAGIAHEIQNPLNFVNNFAEVSVELVDELADEQQKPDRDPALETDLMGDLKQNLQRISQHGNRASGIIRGMLEHARTTTGQKEPTDINALCDEYLRLAYHGLRRSGVPATDKDGSEVRFNCALVTDFDPTLGLVSVVSQDFGRVVLNLLNNAFYAVRERQYASSVPYQPTVTVRTKRLAGTVAITIQDNGMGIPELVKQKIFQPFFTTKPTGSGTGLGLSLSYDIVTKGHGGTLTVESREGEGTTFTSTLPVQ